MSQKPKPSNEDPAPEKLKTELLDNVSEAAIGIVKVLISILFLKK